MRATGQIPVPATGISKSLLKESKKVLAAGEFLGIFPEGTRSRTGRIGLAHPGAAKLALQFNAPIIPVGIIGAYETLSPHDKFPKMEKIIEVNIGAPITNCNRKCDTEDMSNKIMQNIAALCQTKEEKTNGTIYN